MAESAYAHLVAKGIEGFETTGYVPGPNSGVTIGGGVDLKFQTRESLKNDGVPSSIIEKLDPYLQKPGSEVADPSALKLTDEEAKTLTMAFVKKHLKVIEDNHLNQNMKQRGTNVLVSLRQYVGHLENLHNVWIAIKDKTATNHRLIVALGKDQHKYPARRGRLGREIDYLEHEHH